MKITQATFIVFLMSAGSASAGSLGYTPLNPYMDWEPDCSKPIEPMFSGYDNYAIDDFNSYVADMKNYLTCLEDEAAGDLNTIKLAVENGLDDKQTEAVRKVEEVKANLEMMKPY